MAKNNADHYNRVTDAWTAFMGDNFHFGYFEKEDTGLAEATDLLIEQMLRLCPVTRATRLLDVGCGIGGPALYINDKFNCAITGISTSERGVGIAAGRARELGRRDVAFKVADGLANGLPDGSFDVVWIMEASHLFRDKAALFRECRRVLSKGGTLVLCDIMLLQILPPHREYARYLARGAGYLRMLKAFGSARVRSAGTYCNQLLEAGFHDIGIVDITEQTMPTMRRWIAGARKRADGAENHYSLKDVETFIRGCETLDRFFSDRIFGYVMMKARAS